uniref:Uncharacterized protein n=1 Tax=Arundo donax TaxID=35708 RepID=A0A0A9FE19_ARUDO
MGMETLLQHLEMVVYGLLFSIYQQFIIFFRTLVQCIVCMCLQS